MGEGQGLDGGQLPAGGRGGGGLPVTEWETAQDRLLTSLLANTTVLLSTPC